MRDPVMPGRAVCMPSFEYKRLRTRDLAYNPIKDVCARNISEDNFFQDAFVGFIAGAVFVTLLNKGL